MSCYNCGGPASTSDCGCVHWTERYRAPITKAYEKHTRTMREHEIRMQEEEEDAIADARARLAARGGR